MVLITVFFTSTGIPSTSLSPTIRIRRIDTDVLVITDAAMSNVGDGFYKYDFTTYDDTLEYVIRADGTVTLDDVDRYKFNGSTEANIEITLRDTEEIQSKLPTDNIMGSAVLTSKDDEIDAIKLVTDAISIPTVLDIVNGVFDELVATHTTSDSFGSNMELIRKILLNRLTLTNDGADLTLYDDDNSTPILTASLTDINNDPAVVEGTAPASRSKLI